MKARNITNEAGQSLIVIALLMVGIVGFLGLAMDGSRAFEAHRQSQNAADASALAGVRIMALKESDTEAAVWNNITNLSNSNGVPTAQVVATFINQAAGDICTINVNCGGIPANATGVRVTTTLQLQPFFIDILIGKQPIPIRAAAAAQSGTPSIATDLQPMTVCADPTQPAVCPAEYETDEIVRLFGGTQGSGSFQWLDFKNTVISDGKKCQLEDAIAQLCTSVEVMADPPPETVGWVDPPPSPGPWISTNTGIQNDANVSKALDCWIDGTNCLSGQQVSDDRLWIVPVYNHSNGLSGDNLFYHTVMFAEFEFRGYWFANNQCNWVGKTFTQKCNAPYDPTKKDQTISPDLDECLAKTQKCLMGVFKKEVTDLAFKPGPCNILGLDICAVGMSQ